jgi:hypothetical protein
VRLTGSDLQTLCIFLSARLKAVLLAELSVSLQLGGAANESWSGQQ